MTAEIIHIDSKAKKEKLKLLAEVMEEAFKADEIILITYDKTYFVDISNETAVYLLECAKLIAISGFDSEDDEDLEDE